MNNPPAFPVFPETSGGHAAAFQGITMRDYFAAKAMQGYCSDSDWRQDMTPTETAFAAYKQADAMLKAREP